MEKLLKKIWTRFLTILGDIRISKFPPFLYYDTVDFKVKGDIIERVQKILEPGDIIARGYDSYLDSKFIPDPLSFSHGAIYLGNNTVIHAVAEGVNLIHLYDFLQCDRMAVFRPKNKRKLESLAKQAIEISKRLLGKNYDFFFSDGDSAIYCFELVSLAYPTLDIKRVEVKKLFGLIRKHVYIAESLFRSKDLRCVLHFNPKFNMDQTTVYPKRRKPVNRKKRPLKTKMEF